MKTEIGNRILIIEDDFEIRSSVTDILENHGFKVYSAGDGISGIKLAHELNPDLILCDIMMPGKTGHDVLEEVSKNGKYQIPFIFLTAKSELNDIRKGMQMGADDYIVKPFRAKDLVDSIKTRLKRLDGFRSSVSDSANGEIESHSSLAIDQSVFIPDLKNPKFVKLEEIQLIKSNGDLTTIYLNSNSKFNTRKSMSHWEKVLPNKYFYRTHRTYIVNSKYIEKIEPWFKRSYKIKLDGLDENVFISERYAVKLKKLLP